MDILSELLVVSISDEDVKDLRAEIVDVIRSSVGDKHGARHYPELTKLRQIIDRHSGAYED